MDVRSAAAGCALVAVVLLTAGCVLPDQMYQVQADLDDVRRELEEIRAKQAAAETSLTEIASRVSAQDPVSRAAFADLTLRVEDQARTTAALSERIDEALRRVDGLSTSVEAAREDARRAAQRSAAVLPAPFGGDASPAVPTQAPSPTAASPRGAAEALYNAAYADYAKGNYALAISGFEEYAQRFPDSSLADNALYWVGECHFSQGAYDRAIEAFDRMLERHPESDRAAAANLKKGLAYLENNQVAEAIVQLRFVESRYGASDEARIARDKLASLGARP